MNIENNAVSNRPKIIPALTAGFNTAASNIYLIFLPIVIDLAIWFAPHLSVEKVLIPFVRSIKDLPGANTAEASEAIAGFLPQFEELISRFNLSVIVRTYPIGVPSLNALLSPSINPIGAPIGFSLSSMNSIVSIIIVMVFIGLFLGSLYFSQVAGKVHEEVSKPTFNDYTKVTGQVLLLPLFMVAIFIMISIPLVVIIPILTFISPVIGQMGIYLSMVAIIWLLIPLAFTPHSIFLLKQNVIRSMMTSISVVRFSLPGSAFFFLVIFVISTGMNFLWSIPPDNSWMLMVGIIGHAFIATGLVAASYHYFMDAMVFTQNLILEQTNKIKSNPG